MTSKEALERLGNVEVAVTTIRSGITHFEKLKDYYETEFDVLEKELLFIRDIKPFDVYEKEIKKLKEDRSDILKDFDELEKVIEILKDYLRIKVFIDMDNEYCLDACDYAIPYLNKEQYDLLKEYL